VKKVLLLSILVLGLIMFCLPSPRTVNAAQPFSAVCDQLTERERAQSSVCANAEDVTNPITGREGLFAKVVGILSWAIGVVSVMMIIYGGYKYTTSSGDAAKIKAAKETILYAVVGLTIALCARILIIFVLNG